MSLGTSITRKYRKMAAKKKSSKISKDSSPASTVKTANGSESNTRTSSSEKAGRKTNGARGYIFPPKQRNQPLIEEEPEVKSCELVDFNTTNGNIIQQLRLICQYPYIINQDARLSAVDAVQEALNSDSLKTKLQGALVLSQLQKVNLAVFKQLASDQVQRHLYFDRKEDVSAAKKREALDGMTDEELEALQKLSDKMGGAIDLGDK